METSGRARELCLTHRAFLVVAFAAACSGGQSHSDRPAAPSRGAAPAVVSLFHEVEGLAANTKVAVWNIGAITGATLPGQQIPPGTTPTPVPGDGGAVTTPPAGDGSGADPTPPTSPCQALGIDRGVTVGGFLSDSYTWFDQDCKQCSALMIRNTQQDPSGAYGGYLRQYSYDIGGAVRTASPEVSGQPGFGYTVNHINSSSESSRRYAGTTRIVLAGRHHAIHEYKWTYDIMGQPVTITIDWLFATGRSHPLWAVTFDTSAAPPDSVNVDTRAPYGDLAWDGIGGDVDGVGWGDRYKFRSLSSPVTFASGWDYSVPNTVPYTMEWANAADAEMGLVQTQTCRQHDAGGYGNYVNWGKTGTGMPADYNWTYQLNQYEIPFTTKSHRLAWGANFGAVGQRSYPVYGNDGTASGWPYQSYSVYVVLDRHSAAPVATEVAQVETIQQTTLTAAVGSVVTSGPAGVGRTDQVTYEPAGYDHVYGTWDLVAAGNAVDAQLAVASGALSDPVLVVHGWTGGAPTSVRLGERSLYADVEYFASVDAASQTLWLTLPGSFAGSTRIRVQ